MLPVINNKNANNKWLKLAESSNSRKFDRSKRLSKKLGKMRTERFLFFTMARAP